MDLFEDVGKDAERGLQIASGALALALVGGLVTVSAHDTMRLVIIDAIWRFGIAFVIAVIATYCRLGIKFDRALYLHHRWLLHHRGLDHHRGLHFHIWRFVHRFLQIGWCVAILGSFLLFLYSGFCFVTGAAGASRIEAEKSATASPEMIEHLRHLEHSFGYQPLWGRQP